MNTYELLFILPGTMTEEEQKPVADRVQETLEQNGASNIEAKSMGKSRLAYPMKHIRYGYYHVVHFQAEGASLPKMQEKLRLIPEILRSMLQVFDAERASKEVEQYFEKGPVAHISREKEGGRSRKPSPTRKETSEKPVKEEASEENKKEETEEAAAPNIDLKEIDKKLDEITGDDAANNV
ncbi:30S ribosomal protein S6 [Candidatus Nomurabacteria bacterium]|nr:30S ribosomal protein S6 [Candidatus Nomurabacteria bacterium]